MWVLWDDAFLGGQTAAKKEREKEKEIRTKIVAEE